jgi:hypothetical protein
MSVFDLEYFPAVQTFERTEYMLIDNGNGPVWVHLSVVEDLFNLFLEDQRITRNDHIYLMRALFDFNSTGTVSHQMFRLPDRLEHPFWLDLWEHGTMVHFHIVVECMFQEAHMPPPADLFGEVVLDAEELHQDLWDTLREWVEDEINEDFTAAAA